MPVITLPDGSQREFDAPVSVHEVAANIGPGLAKAAVVGKVDGTLVDTHHVIAEDAQLAIVTAKDDEGVEVIRHSCAHLMAQAVQQLYPGTQVTIGPVIENGFYYDFATVEPLTEDDLGKIEARMAELAKQQIPIERSLIGRDDAVAFFTDKGEAYKAEIVDSIPSNEDLSLYTQAEFVDLCRGPHVPNTGFIKAFKLMSVAGAYWRGDSNNAMLQRVYGTAWADKKALKAYLHQLEEAEKRDHRKIAKQQNLFHLQEEAPGMVFWHPNGWTLWQQVEQYMRQQQSDHGYLEIRTPQIIDRSLWEKSGHWEKYAENMFTTQSEDRDYAVKPMNCPGHVQVFNQGLRSYRDLPLRFTEFGLCHRNELSGALHGIMRVRGFVQDDGHIFCTEEQILSESLAFIDFLHRIYADFGFDDIIYKLSTRPEKRVGSDETWDRAEKALAEALDAKGIDWEELPGEGAFYGPKIEFSLKDTIGRVWQCGTLQVDFNMPGRLGSQYVNEAGERDVPVLLHRATIGSFERFIGILIEHHAGRFPAWLAPEQAVVLNITDAQGEYAENTAKALQDKGFRVSADLRNEKIGFKIRNYTLQRVPYLLVVGDREMDAGSCAVRTRDGEDLGTMSIDAFAERLGTEVANRGRTTEEG
ncbi:MAG: threonine--tRNA ligase [Pseudomonadota bacterium]